jgi:hypothetical protein
MQPGIQISCNLNLEVLLKHLLMALLMLTSLTLIAQSPTVPASVQAQAAQRQAKQEAAAQPSVPVTGALKDVIDLHITKIQNDQLQMKDIQNQYQSVTAALKADYDKEVKAYNEAVEKARKELKVPNSDELDPKDFTFKAPPVVPTK